MPELNRKEIREVVVGNDRIVHRIGDALVEILTVLLIQTAFMITWF